MFSVEILFQRNCFGKYKKSLIKNSNFDITSNQSPPAGTTLPLSSTSLVTDLTSSCQTGASMVQR